MPSSSKPSRPLRAPVPPVYSRLSSLPQTLPPYAPRLHAVSILPAVDLVPMKASDVIISGRSDSPLLPDSVPEPEYVIRGNRVKCTWCGAKLKTRVKYVNHFIRRHM